jgi:hypothetical protein
MLADVRSRISMFTFTVLLTDEMLSVETHIHMCIYAYLRVCVYLFSTVNCILVIQEYEHSLFIFRCRYILTKKYLVKFFCARMCLSSLFFF